MPPRTVPSRWAPRGCLLPGGCRRRSSSSSSPMATRDPAASWVLPTLLLCFGPHLSLGGAAASGGGGACELSVAHRNTLYNYSLAAPTPTHPHGVLSEDGFYKVEASDTTLWFQLCDQMIFNHDPPTCFNCEDCGGPLHCGMKCNALVSNNIGGYDVCTTIGGASTTHLSVIDKSNPKKGVIFKIVSVGSKNNCSLSVSIFCDLTVQVPDSFNMSGTCDYTTVLKHPSGCAHSISERKGWSWFGTLVLVILCLFGGYLLVGMAYRFFFLRIHSLEAIPNLGFWISLPQRTKMMLDSLLRRSRGHGGGNRGSYSRMDF